jgi:ATP-dependent DNA helicase DinG
MLADRLFARHTVVLTSATLALGGSFEPLARQWGLPPLGDSSGGAAGRGTSGGQIVPNGSAVGSTSEPDAPPGRTASGNGAHTRLGQAAARVDAPPEHDAAGANAARPDEPAEDARATAGASALAWSGIDVGSPFDHPRSGILYVARHLPPPGRDGLPEAYLDELAELIIAAGGRTLGLFSSMRGARQAADELRDRIGHPLLCQGDDATSQLITQFAGDEPTCLFGTLSLWQGVDVPGPSLQLVAIDRIPFPRPDDPLASARQRAVSAHGGNGFMTVAATGAALLLAQGTGRLLRTMTDRGVVAILDPRLVTARYGSFLRASLPPFWTTTDPEVVRGALRRLAASSCA